MIAYKGFERGFICRGYQFMLSLIHISILECKTSTSGAGDHWLYNGRDVVPAYYESQGRHYMAVMNISRVYFCCLFTDTREAIIRVIERDMACLLYTSRCV